MNDPIKISVIVPIHHGDASFLDKCLSSLCSQTFKDFEAILVLNDSTENDQIISLKYCQSDTRFKLFEIDDADVSSARNIGLKNAQGKYIVFLDCDDWLSAGALQTLYNLMESKQGDIGAANAQKVWINGKKKNLFHFENYEEEARLKAIPNFAVWGYIFKNDIIKDNYIRFCEGLKLSEDRVFLFEYFLYCKKIVFSKEIIYFYRQHNLSVCNSKQTHEQAIQQLKAAIILHNILAKSPEFLKKDIRHHDRALARMGMVAYINSGTTPKGIAHLRDYFLNNICNSKLIFYYCWYRAIISSIIGNILHL